MANSNTLCASFLKECMTGHHALGTTVTRGGTTADTIKAALILTSGSLGVSTTTYDGTSEVSGTNYSAGGVTVTNATAPATSGSTAYWTPSASIVYTTVTIASSFNAIQLYNSTQSNRSIGIFTFGSVGSITAGTFTLTMPTNDSSTGLIRLTAS